MAYKALYRSYRPNSFNSVIGQEHIIQTLKNALINGKTSHAYIFSGPRGIGKTTIARILAKAINCEDLQNGEPCNKCAACKLINNSETPDIVEFDAASNNGVEEIRNVLEKVNFLPSVLKHKVYIIDEVHMLSISAFNALLKTLEEPPAHVMFILATTEVHKIPATILSRCQRFDFKPLTVKEIKNNLKNIAEKEKIDIEADALNLVAEASDGGMRDAISILDQVNAYSTKTISLEDVNSVTGQISNQKLVELMQAIKENNSIKAVEITNELVSLGKEVSRIVQSLLQLCRDILLYQSTDGEAEGKLIYDDVAFKMLCNALNKKKIFFFIDVLSDIQNKIKFSLSQKIFLEVGIMKMATATFEEITNGVASANIPEDVEDRISKLEAQLSKVKSELVHLNLAEFKNETKEKFNLLEDATSNGFVSNIPSDLVERIEKIENQLTEPHSINIDSIQTEIELIKNQLNGNNIVENTDDFEKLEALEQHINEISTRVVELENGNSPTSSDEWLKIEDSIKLMFNQIDEITLKVQELETSLEPKEPTLFDYVTPNNNEIENLKQESNELKLQIANLQETYNHIEETLNELILSNSKEEQSIQKRINPYEQKVLDIVEQQQALEEPEELVTYPVEELSESEADEDIPTVEMEPEELVTYPVEELSESKADEDIPTVEMEPEELVTEPVEELSELEADEETPVAEEDLNEQPKQIQFNLYDLYDEVKPKALVVEENPQVETVPAMEEKEEVIPTPIPEVKVVEDDIPDINNMPDERPVELHYDLNCNVAQLEKDLRVINLSDDAPQDVNQRVMENIVGMKNDMIAFIKDKQLGVYDEKPSLEADAKRNIKTFLIMLSSRDAMGVTMKSASFAEHAQAVKDLIKDYRSAVKGLVTTYQEARIEAPIEESKPVIEEKIEVATQNIVEEPVQEEVTVEEQVDKEVAPIPEVIEQKPAEEPKYVRATILETKPKNKETVKLEDDNPYAIEKIEAVMHDSRSEISREERKIILSNWRKLGDRVGTALAPVARFLIDGQPVVNGNNCIIITYPNAALCNHIMGEKIRFEAKQILKITFGREYDFIALPEDVWQDKRNEYRGQYQMGSRYPKLTPIDNPELKIIKHSFVEEKSESYNKALDLFGENLIKEEEE